MPCKSVLRMSCINGFCRSGKTVAMDYNPLVFHIFVLCLHSVLYVLSLSFINQCTLLKIHHDTKAQYCAYCRDLQALRNKDNLTNPAFVMHTISLYLSSPLRNEESCAVWSYMSKLEFLSGESSMLSKAVWRMVNELYVCWWRTSPSFNSLSWILMFGMLQLTFLIVFGI